MQHHDLCYGKIFLEVYVKMLILLRLHLHTGIFY